MVKLVLFDIDGTLVRTGGAGVRAFAKVFSTEFQLENGFECLKFAGRTDLSLVREFFRFHGITATAEHFERFFERYVFWLDHIMADSHKELCPGVESFMMQLASLPHPPVLGLLTGNIRLGAEIKLQHFGIWDRFVVGGFGDDAEDRDRIAAVAKHRGSQFLGTSLADEEVLVIGDTPLDIRCGRAISAKVLAVATGGATFDTLIEHQADWTVPDLTKIQAATVCA